MRMCWLPSAKACGQYNFAPTNPTVLNWRCRLTQVDLCIMAVKRWLWLLCLRRLTPKSWRKFESDVAVQNTMKTTITVSIVFRTFISVWDSLPPPAAAAIHVKTFFNVLNVFTARCYASAVLAMALCLSVRLSVCPSQVGVLLKRLNVGSHKQHHTIAQGL